MARRRKKTLLYGHSGKLHNSIVSHLSTYRKYTWRNVFLVRCELKIEFRKCQPPSHLGKWDAIISRHLINLENLFLNQQKLQELFTILKIISGKTTFIFFFWFFFALVGHHHRLCKCQIYSCDDWVTRQLVSQISFLPTKDSSQRSKYNPNRRIDKFLVLWFVFSIKFRKQLNLECLKRSMSLTKTYYIKQHSCI